MLVLVLVLVLVLRRLTSHNVDPCVAAVDKLGRMMQSLLFGVFGVIAGLAFTVFGTRIARALRASQTKAFGAAAGRMVTPTFVQVIGIFFVMVGGFMIFLALTGRG